MAKHHGYRKVNATHPLYKVWNQMKERCKPRGTAKTKNYGDRGITVCERWLHSFPNFLADMGERPAGSQLDRYPDQNGNYEPSNCRWATRKAQMNNRRDNNKVAIDGDVKTVTEWSEISGQHVNTIRERLARGIDPRLAVFTKQFPGKSGHERYIKISGKRKTIREWATETGIGETTLKYRFDNGWNPELAISKKPRYRVSQ